MAPKKQQTFLVTGGGGFLGGAIVRLLVSESQKVRSFSRAYYAELEALGVEQVQGDLTDLNALQSACRGVETVFHVAARPGVWGRFDDFYNPNVIGTRNVVTACRACGVQRLIYTSSPSVIFNGKDMAGVDESTPYPTRYHAFYPMTKAMAEQMVLEAAANGLPGIVLRPHLIWGPGDNHLAPRILARASRLRQVGNGQNLVDTIYIDNAARAHVLADRKLKQHPKLSGRIYFISQDEPIPLWRMVNAILAAGGKPPVTKRISPGAAWLLGMFSENVYRMFRLKGEPPMTRFVARELATTHWFNIQAAKRDLGYHPDISIAQGLERLAGWIKTARRQEEILSSIKA